MSLLVVVLRKFRKVTRFRETSIAKMVGSEHNRHKTISGLVFSWKNHDDAVEKILIF